MNRCGCNPISEPFEYSLNPNLKRTNNYKFNELFPIQIDREKLKDKLICEFEEILDKLECGLHPDLEPLLEDLSWLYIKEKIFAGNAIYIPPTNYVGFAGENLEELNLESLTKRHQENIRMEEIIKNEIYGSHLWVVSPYALHKVSTDESFVYEVKMNSIAYIDGLHYYRSNSKVDVCKLTYYIK